SLENKIRRLLNAGKYAEAEIWKAKLIDDSKYPEASRVSLEADFSYSRQEYAKAKNFAIKALRKINNSHTINILGKSSFKLRDFPLAISCFERLKLYSPANIERLCMLAEAKAEVS